MHVVLCFKLIVCLYMSKDTHYLARCVITIKCSQINAAHSSKQPCCLPFLLDTTSCFMSSCSSISCREIHSTTLYPSHIQRNSRISFESCHFTTCDLRREGVASTSHAYCVTGHHVIGMVNNCSVFS